MKVLYIDYALWKSIVQTKSFSTFHKVGATDTRKVWAGTSDAIFAADVQPGADFTDWQANFEAGSTVVLNEDVALANIIGLGAPITAPLSANNYQQVSVHPPENDKKTFYTQNWADPTTWYEGATRQVDTVLNNTGDDTTYVVPSWAATKHIIDVSHGKMTNEHLLLDAASNSYAVTVKVNDVVKTEQDPHLGSGSDFTVDYDAGEVTFLAALAPADVVKMTYHLVDRSAGDGSASCWTLKPATGKILEITKVEVQFSDNIVLSDSVVFQAYIGGTPVGPADVYKTMMDFYNDANGAYPVMPALGGTGWRGCLEAVYALPWQYQSVTKLASAINLEVRLCLKHDVPFGTDNANPATATATFYCLSVDGS